MDSQMVKALYPSIHYYHQRIYNQVVTRLVEENKSPGEILYELRRYTLETDKTTIEKLETNIEGRLYKAWNDGEKRWTDISPEIVIPETIIGTEIQLNDNDAQTLLKDLSYILQDLKALTTDIAKITKGIDTAAYNLKEIALAIKPRS